MVAQRVNSAGVGGLLFTEGEKDDSESMADFPTDIVIP